MAVTIMKQGNSLVVSMQVALSDAEWRHFQKELLERARSFDIRGVIVDLSGMDIVDSFASRMLNDLVRMLRLEGAEVVVIGIQPDVAFAMARLGLRLTDIPTALDFDEGMDLLRSRLKGRRSHA